MQRPLDWPHFSKHFSVSHSCQSDLKMQLDCVTPPLENFVFIAQKISPDSIARLKEEEKRRGGGGGEVCVCVCACFLFWGRCLYLFCSCASLNLNAPIFFACWNLNHPLSLSLRAASFRSFLRFPGQIWTLLPLYFYLLRHISVHSVIGLALLHSMHVI